MSTAPGTTPGWGDTGQISTSTSLTLDDVLAIHEGLVARFGGPLGVRDVGVLESDVTRPGTGNYEGFLEEAAALMESLAMNTYQCGGVA